jgi:peroxiredoxin
MAARGQHRLLEEGSRAPEFRLELLDGGTSTLAQILAGGPALLAFFKISCPVCQMTFPFLERLHADGAVRIFGVSQDDAGDTLPAISTRNSG